MMHQPSAAAAGELAALFTVLHKVLKVVEESGHEALDKTYEYQSPSGVRLAYIQNDFSNGGKVLALVLPVDGIPVDNFSGLLLGMGLFPRMTPEASGNYIWLKIA